MLDALEKGAVLEFVYVNHRNKSEDRRVVFNRFQFGSNEYYPTPQFFLLCYCLDRKAYRSFAVSEIVPHSFRIAS